MQSCLAVSLAPRAVIDMSRTILTDRGRFSTDTRGVLSAMMLWTIFEVVSVQALLCVGGVATPAAAGNERDWDDCNADDPVRSLVACTRILLDKHEKKRALAFYNRGYVYKIRGDLERAIADYDHAIRLEPEAAAFYYDRGVAYHAGGGVNRAIVDYNKAIRLDPGSFRAYRARGLAYLYSGASAKALADVSQASEIDPKNAYTALWVDIVGSRNNIASRLPQAILNIDMTAWPAPVIRMFLGEMTPYDVRAAAEDPDAGKRQGQLCEADFYSGELALRRGARGEMVRLFRLAASDCPHDFEEWIAANAELRALGASRRTSSLR
jgi:lipoprotein NlpI